MKKTGILKNLVHGGVIGASMLIPGVSGGTTAILLGIYDKLIHSVSALRREMKKSFLYLLQVAVGGVLGMLILAKPLLWVVTQLEFYAMYLFMGVIVASVPMMMKKAGARKLSLVNILLIAAGFALLFLTTLIPEGLMQFSSAIGVWEFILLIIVGAVLSAALVLPGISVTFTMLVFGIYSRFLEALENIDLMFLLPLGLGLVIGTLALAKALDTLFSRYTAQTYSVISGFVLATVFEIFPGLPSGLQIAYCVAAFAVGFIPIYMISQKFD